MTLETSPDQYESISRHFGVIELGSEVRRGGAEVRYLDVDDESRQSETYEETNAQLDFYEAWLKANPEVAAPYFDKDLGDLVIDPANEAANYFFKTKTMRDWRSHLVPKGAALYPIQRPFESQLPEPCTEIIDDESRLFFLDTKDSVGIRVRARIMADIAKKYVNPDDETHWVSLACGAALPVIEAAKSGQLAKGSSVSLIDWDPSALEFAAQLANEEQLVDNVSFTSKEANLITGMIGSDELVADIGEGQADMVEALGIFEYFKDDRAAKFLHNSYRLVKPGGALILANMMDTHPQLEFNKRAVGWPRLYPRSLEDLEAIAQKAGIPLKSITFTQANDEVYTVMEIRK